MISAHLHRLFLPRALLEKIRKEGERAYPAECCGILTGREKAGVRTVSAVSTVENRSALPLSHYEIDPKEVIRVQREAREAGAEVIGFYHSHPDHAAHWSATDLSEAHWLGCSYIITAVGRGRAADTRSFRLAGALEEDKRFEVEELRMLDDES